MIIEESKEKDRMSQKFNMKSMKQIEYVNIHKILRTNVKEVAEKLMNKTFNVGWFLVGQGLYINYEEKELIYTIVIGKNVEESQVEVAIKELDDIIKTIIR